MEAQRVLLVEDDQDLVRLMTAGLRRLSEDFVIDAVASAQACMDKIAHNTYEAIVLDYHLADQNALDVLEAISESKCATPVVVVSGNGSEQIAVATLKRGARDYLVKDQSFLRMLPQVVQKTIEQGRLERRLAAQEQKFRVIFQQAKDGIVILDTANFGIAEVNFKTGELSGYRPEELVNTSFLRLFPEDCQERVREILHQTVAKSACRDDELSLLCKIGKRIPVEIDTCLVDLNMTAAVVCHIRNISEKKALQNLILNSKRRLQSTFDGITDMIFQVDSENNLVIVNKRFAESCSASPEELIGRKYYQVLYRSERPVEGCPVQTTLLSGEPHFLEFNLEFNKEDKVYEISTYPIFTLEHKLEAVAAYAKDVTQKKRFEKALIQSEKLSTIGLLASGIAHELRNPLNVIETARYYMEEFLVERDSEIAEKLDVIGKSVRRSSKIINNLLEFSRHSAQDGEYINLRSLVENTVSLIHKELHAKNIDFQLVCADPNTIFFSRDSLKQVLLNVIINAIQAMRQGGHLRIAVEKNQHGWIDLKITDTGIGIPEENVPHLFSPFFTTKEVGEGTGLGLYIAHMIITREGGHIAVESEVNRGTTFCISLPERKK